MKYTVKYLGPGGQAKLDGTILPRGRSLVLELGDRRVEYLRATGRYEVEPIFVPALPSLPYPGPDTQEEEE